MDRENDRQAEEDSAPSPAPGQMKVWLKVVVRYLVLGFAPVVSLLALVIALIAFYGNQASRGQINEAKLRMDGMSATMADLKGEQELFKLPFGREKSAMGDERKKQNELDAQIIKNVTQLQIKLKIAPTLEEQLRVANATQAIAAPVASAPAVAHPASGAVAAPVAKPAPNDKKPAVAPAAAEAKPAVARKEAEKTPAVAQQGAEKKPVAVPQQAEKKPVREQKGAVAKPAAVPKATDKTSSKVQSLKEAIKIYNESN